MVVPVKLIWGAESQGPQRVDDWMSAPMAYKTIAIYANNLNGTVTIQGSIENNPTVNDWYDIYVATYTRPDPNSNPSQNSVFSINSKVVWMRANFTIVDFGTVDRILVL
jgi:hypothetical protein